MAEEYSTETSKYNEGFFQIQRLNNQWIFIENDYRKGNLKGVKWGLDGIWRELSGDVYERMTPEKRKEILAEEKKTKEYITKAQEKEDNTQLYEALNRRHIFLKRVQDKTGKGGSYSDSLDDELE